ncbi:DUF1624 domain-containing protein [Hymenobacter ginsengisoli]|uniref:DUF1624 domain-containing protein n=1 Tax=Hymenobacter ginsengisoli TaxID=1051626 RepID=A0ABP8Q1Q1_9BACT|nr:MULTISPECIES: heparan-alpha-glucosaminide N-acetyltransferase domain-containing protein [unclassified Hymenobacter]MBO2032523.1 DUF1624 domain-containing protein [Hymenobacter sp. BT559]
MNQTATPTLASPAATGRAATARVPIIDVVRGLAMVIMAIDHIREFWCPTPMRPEDVAQAPAALFLTRWVTHFCAPTFVFLAGASVFLYQQKRASRGQVSRFLLTRGLWLVVLELVVINFILQWGYPMLVLEVIWALGCSMVLLAGAIWLPRWLLAGLALAIIMGQHLLPLVQPVTGARLPWALLYDSPFLFATQPVPVLAAYTILPWAAVMALGYVAGPWFKAEAPLRARWLRLAGGAALVFFIAVRATNLYGDPSRWSEQARGAGYTLLSFLNVTKYPPSLLFLSLTLGGALVLLSLAGRLPGRLGQWLSIYGRVPLFYFVLHFCLISGGAYVWTRLAFGQAINLSFASVKDWPAAYHPSLLRLYTVWVAVLLLTYWPCRWYQGYKQRHTYWWLSYL